MRSRQQWRAIVASALDWEESHVRLAGTAASAQQLAGP